MASQKILKPMKYCKPYTSGNFKWKDRLEILTISNRICKTQLSLKSEDGVPPIFIDFTVDYGNPPSSLAHDHEVRVLVRYLGGPLKKIHLTYGLSLTKPWAK